MKLQFLYHPVPNAAEAARFYRDHFGWTELWREQDTTIAIKMPGTDVALMLDQDDGALTAGGFFEVPKRGRHVSRKERRVSIRRAPARHPGWALCPIPRPGPQCRAHSRLHARIRDIPYGGSGERIPGDRPRSRW